MDRVAWQAIVHRIAKSWIWLKWLSTHTRTWPIEGFLGGSVDKEFTCNAGGPRFSSWIGKLSWRMNGNSLSYSWLGCPMDREAWWAPVHGVGRVGHDLVTKLHWPIEMLAEDQDEESEIVIFISHVFFLLGISWTEAVFYLRLWLSVGDLLPWL